MAESIDSIFEPTPEVPTGLTHEQLRGLLQQQANLIVSTGTGGPSFNSADPQYKKGDAALVASFKRLGLQPPFPWRSLWDWHAYYSMNLGTYRERRQHIADLTREALAALDGASASGDVHDPTPGGDDPTWEGVNLRLAALIEEYRGARDRDTWQDVGRRSREILIDLGKLIADPALVPEGEEPPKGADARKWFGLLLQQRASGADKKELRAMMRATWDLAQKVTHGDISAVDAFASAQATVLLVRTTQMLLESLDPA